MPDESHARCRHRIGIGNDLHRLVAGRKLIVGGIRIPFEKGSAGHSDGDVVSHAACDALLGAAALGDIGRHFPDTSPEWNGASSLVFLRQVRRMLEEAGYRIVNLDVTIGLERPKLASRIAGMKKKVAKVLGIQAGQVSLKAKTAEGLDAVGRGDAIRADAVALIEKIGAPAK